MRQSYLEAYYNIIPSSQQDRLLQILKNVNDAAGVSSDPATLQKQIAVLIAQLKQPLGQPLVQLRLATKYGKIVSEDYNNTMREAYVDLGALFKQNNNINRTIIIHRAINDAAISDAKSALSKVENDIMVYKILRHNQEGVTDAVYNTFLKDDNQVSNNSYRAWMDIGTNSVKLPVGVDHSSLSLNGLTMANISLTQYGGGIRGMLENEEHNAEKAIDGSSSTFWGEAILTDQPITQVYNGNTVFGAVCEIKIDLFRAEFINYIRYTPFAGYPLTVLAIKYRPSSSAAWVDTGITPQKSTSIMDFHFSEVYAKEVMIVINQENLSVYTYKLPRRIVNNAQLWQQIADRTLSILVEEEDINHSTQDMLDYVDGWQAFLDANKLYSDRLKTTGKPPTFMYTDSMAESIFDSATKQMLESSEVGADSLKLDLYGKKQDLSQDLVEVRKYEYVYGAYEIDVKKMWFIDKGEYISPKYSPSGPIIRASLEVTDIIPSGTSAEYQLATRDGEWKNILPEDRVGYITKERLDLDEVSRAGILRFACSGVPNVVYRDSINLPSSAYSFRPSYNDITLTTQQYVPDASYTVSYTPAGIVDISPSGVLLDFSSDNLISSEEVFQGGDSRQYKVTLSHSPYVDYRPINDTSKALTTSPSFYYSLGRWQNITASGVYGVNPYPSGYYDVLNVTVDGYAAENMTDYYNNTRPALTKYNLISYPNFEYIHAGKNLYFNVPLQNRTIKVVYSYLNDFIQFRALLRNNLKSTVTQTPILQDYTIKLRTL